MSLPTFPWDDIGLPNRLQVTDICHTIGHNHFGYSASRPGANLMQKAFSLVWERMQRDQWKALLTFWRAMYGSACAFYWEFPMSLYGILGYGGGYIPDPTEGFDADVDTGFGGAPVFTVRFVGKELYQRTLAGPRR